MSDATLIALSVVIPCYNEARRLPPTLQQTLAYLRGCGCDYEIIVVDDGSADDTAAAAQAAAAGDARVRVIRYTPNRGKGYAVRTGMLAATKAAVLFMDADNSTEIEEVEKCAPWLLSGAYDIVIGSRANVGTQLVRTQHPMRKMLGKLYGVLTRSIAFYGIRDTQCGFKLFTHAAAQTVFDALASPSAIFDIELLMRASRAGLHIKEVGVTWTHDPESRLTYNARKSLLIFLELLKIKWRLGTLLPVRARTQPRR
jgi:dolichyl-phosphate beta-glucosyltransferase